MSRVARAVLLGSIAMVVLGGCRARATISIRVDDDGRGELTATLTLDRDAVARVVGFGDSLDDAVRLDGFADSGWTVEPWVTNPESGAATLGLRQSFVGGQQLESMLRELGGDWFDIDVDLRHERGVWSSADSLRIDIDATKVGVRVADDVELAQRLTIAGYDVAAGDAALTKELARSLRIEVAGAVPGDATSVELRPGETVVLQAASSATELDRLVALVGATLAVFVGLWLMWVGLRRRGGAPGIRSPSPDDVVGRR